MAYCRDYSLKLWVSFQPRDCCSGLTPPRSYLRGAGGAEGRGGPPGSKGAFPDRWRWVLSCVIKVGSAMFWLLESSHNHPIQPHEASSKIKSTQMAFLCDALMWNVASSRCECLAAPSNACVDTEVHSWEYFIIDISTKMNTTWTSELFLHVACRLAEVLLYVHVEDLEAQVQAELQLCPHCQLSSLKIVEHARCDLPQVLQASTPARS